MSLLSMLVDGHVSKSHLAKNNTSLTSAMSHSWLITQKAGGQKFLCLWPLYFESGPLVGTVE